MLRADWLLLCLVLLLEGWLIGRFWSPSEGGWAEIHGPHGTQRLSLEHDAKHSISGAIGLSQLEVKDGKIRFVQSPCRRKICIRSGVQHRPGQATACVPNKIGLSIVGPAEQEFDALHF